MIEIKEALKANGCSKEVIEVAMQSVTLIASGDFTEFFKTVNAMCQAQAELSELKDKLSVIAPLIDVKPEKRTYVRKHKEPAVETKETLLDKAGVKAASEALKEQAPAVEEQAPASAPRKVKKESIEEIKASVESLGEVKMIDL